MNKVCYTAIIGQYDLLKSPVIMTRGWRYICYTDQKDLRSKRWEIRYLDQEDDKPRMARRIKILTPDEYDLSIWVDGSIQVRCNLDNFVQHYCNSYMSLMTHPFRNNIIDEAIACIKRKKDDKDIIDRQIQHYARSGYKFDNGLVATGVIVRRNCDQVKNFCNLWYDQIKDWSYRDQLSFNYIASICPLQFNLMPFEITNNEMYLHKHNVSVK